MAKREPAEADHDDPFDSLLTIEDSLYTTAFAQGASDGARAGRIEGRVFGLEKGFEKFAALGELHGRSVVWGARLPSLVQQPGNVEPSTKTLPNLAQNTRLRNHVTMLHSLTDPLTFSTDNTEDAVADFDDRLKRAGAKAKVIERSIGEDGSHSASDSPVILFHEGRVEEIQPREK